MRAVGAAEFDAIEKQVRERKSRDCLSMTTDFLRGPRHQLRSALVDGEHVVDRDLVAKAVADGIEAEIEIAAQLVELTKLRDGGFRPFV